MKTTVIDVRDLLSPLSASGVEKQLVKSPGILQVEVNRVSGSATVEYDEAVTSLSDIKAKVSECGHHCGGEIVPKHLCEQKPSHPAKIATESTRETLRPKQPDHGEHTQSEPISHAVHADMAGMAHEMGHGAGMDMRTMARDMRNRFIVALLFAIPVVLYSSMGLEFLKLEPPFGIERNIFLLVLASGALFLPAGRFTWRRWPIRHPM